MTRPLSRRRLIAAAVPGLLAGCLIETPEAADGGAGTGDDSGTDTGDSPSADGDGGTSTGGSGSDGGDGEGDDGEGGGGSDGEGGDGGDQGDDEPDPDAVEPAGSGLVITETEVRAVTNDGAETTVDARLTVENRGQFTYGTIEFRVDAYATVPNTNDRDEVGFAYVSRRFLSDDRFEDGTRTFDVAITFRSSESNVPSDVDWYDVDAAVRVADPV